MMVKLTTNYLIRKIVCRKQLQVRRKDETDRQFLSRITHLHLQGLFIDQIGEIKECQCVLVVYLQNNALKTIHNFENFLNVTHLYLQRNKLTKIENLEKLKNLRKIYLGYNQISVLEGLQNLDNLTEIHIEGQILPLGETLYFDPRTIRNLGPNLHVINVSNNNLTTLSGLEGLFCLYVLIAADNKISELEDLCSCLPSWPILQKLNLIGNPVTFERKYRDDIIYNSKALAELDDKDIHDNTRTFIENLNLSKESRLKLSGTTIKNGEPLSDGKDTSGVSPWPSFFNSKGSIPSFPHDYGLEVPYNLYPGWKLRTNINPVNPKTFLPRPFWKKPPKANPQETRMENIVNI